MSLANSSTHRIRLELESVQIVSIDHVAAFDNMDAFLSLVRKADATEHFATPNFIFNGEGGIVGGDWRVESSAAPMLLSLASPERVQRAYAIFNDAVQRILKVAQGKRDRALLESAINVPHNGDVLLVDDTLVLTNWGLLPSRVVTTRGRIAHRRDVVGIDVLQQESLERSETQANTGTLDSIADGSQRTISETERRRVQGSIRAIAVGAALLAVLLIPGVLLFEGEFHARQSFEPLMDAGKKNNEQLRSLLDVQERRINDFECPVAYLDQTDGFLTTTASMSRRDLRKYAEQATVLIVVSGEKPGIGTGFFISPTEILTNAHVVGDELQVEVSSAALGGSFEVDVSHRAYDDTAGLDFALLSLPRPASVTPLRLTYSLEAGEEVFAAGFPENMVEIEMQAQKNSGAGITATMHFTYGTVSALAAAGLQTAFISHTSLIMGGNSGGPLLDRCGNVVGINTSVAPDRRVYTAFGIALPVKRAEDFLSMTDSDVKGIDEVCTAGPS